MKLRPGALAPYFLFAALVHAAAVVSRCDVVAAKLPAEAATLILAAQLPLILLSGYLEGRLDYGRQMDDFPLWMRIRSAPVKLAFTFAFIYLTLVPLQVWNVSLGPIDPTPPAHWPEAQRVGWFLMFTFVMFFPFYLAACGALIPVLRTITAPLRKLPTIVGVVIALAVGAAAGVGAVHVMASKQIGGGLKAIQGALSSDPLVGVVILIVFTVIPAVVGAVLETRADQRG